MTRIRKVIVIKTLLPVNDNRNNLGGLTIGPLLFCQFSKGMWSNHNQGYTKMKFCVKYTSFLYFL
jgi:hypothetical protein